MDEELKSAAGEQEPVPADAAADVTQLAAAAVRPDRMPAVYLGHGAPPLVDDPLWTTQLAAWAGALPKPTAILVVSAHWESAPLTIGATEDAAPLVYDFYGFPQRYYQATCKPLARRISPGKSVPCCQGPSRLLTLLTAASTTEPTCR